MTRVPLTTLDGYAINYQITGTGTAVIALHGFTGSGESWDSFSRTANSQHTILTIDLPGHGKSDSPADRSLYTFPKMVDALGELLVLLDIDRVHWLGYSMGGRLALAACARLPERSRSLTIVSTSPGIEDEEERNDRLRSDLELADRIEQKGITWFVDYWERLPMWGSQKRMPDHLRQKLRAQRLTNNPVGLANSLRGSGPGAQAPLHSRLTKIDLPVLIFSGSLDEKYSKIGAEMAKALPDSSLLVLEAAGHAVQLERESAFNSAVLEFINRVDNRAACRGSLNRLQCH